MNGGIAIAGSLEQFNEFPLTFYIKNIYFPFHMTNKEQT